MTDSPYGDWEDFKIVTGSRVSFVGLDGKMYTGTVQSVDENKETGEITMTMHEHDAP